MAKHLWILWKKQIDQLMEAGGCPLRVPGDTAHHLADILDAVKVNVSVKVLS